MSMICLNLLGKPKTGNKPVKVSNQLNISFIEWINKYTTYNFSYL